jgi:hypothetical protein
LFEINEAFAAVPMRFMREMNVPHDKVNVNGGAIAMGHPLGATGAMLLGTLLDELELKYEIDSDGDFKVGFENFAKLKLRVRCSLEYVILACLLINHLFYFNMDKEQFLIPY